MYTQKCDSLRSLHNTTHDNYHYAILVIDKMAPEGTGHGPCRGRGDLTRITGVTGLQGVRTITATYAPATRADAIADLTCTCIDITK